MTQRALRYPAVALLFLGGLAWAMEPPKKETTVTKEVTRDGKTVTTTTYQKSSELLGTPITTNSQNVGKVEDLVIDANTGRVVYGIGSFTHVQGADGKLYPIPWPAGTYSTQSRTYNLSVEPTRIQAGPSFTRTEWPNLTDDAYVTKTYQTYNTTPYWQSQKTVVKTSDRPTTTVTSWTQPPTTTYRVSELRGRQIYTSEGTVLGPINEVVLDPATGQIVYAVTVRDGKSVPIPWTALRAKDKDFMITVTADRWKTAPVVESETWTTVPEPRWTQEVYRYYEVEPVKVHDHDDDD